MKYVAFLMKDNLDISTTKLFAVTGKPIVQSKSPQMYNAAFADAGIDATYFRLAAESAEQAIFLFKQIELAGMNVTSPFKETIMPLLDEVHDEAQKIGGVNTIVNRNDKLHGYNTDYYGVIQSFEDAGIDLKDKKCVVLGAGGAAKAAAYGLLQKGAHVVIVNRTYDKAVAAAEKLGCQSAPAGQLQQIMGESEIIVSALTRHVNIVQPEWLKSSHIIFDANYKDSPLVKMANDKGCNVIDAEHWLLHQAVMSFELYTGQKSNTSVMQEALNDSLNAKFQTVSFIGMMGTGKTSLGKPLAEAMHRAFKDTDIAIVEKYKMTISEIFQRDGEPVFRRLEAEELSRSFHADVPYVVSCGGGIVKNENNRKLLKQNALVIWLVSSPKSILSRINISKRPLLQVDDPEKKLAELIGERKALYAKTADLAISTEGWDVHKLIAELMNEFEYL